MNLNKAMACCRKLPGAMEDLKRVYIEEPKAVSDAEAAELLQRSYELVSAKLTKKLQREIQGT